MYLLLLVVEQLFGYEKMRIFIHPMFLLVNFHAPHFKLYKKDNT